MVVLLEVVPAGGSHRLQLVVGQAAPEVLARSVERVHKQIFGIFYLVGRKYRPQAALIESRIVRHEGNYLYRHIGKISQLIDELDEKGMRWLELSEFA